MRTDMSSIYTVMLCGRQLEGPITWTIAPGGLLLRCHVMWNECGY